MSCDPFLTCFSLFFVLLQAINPQLPAGSFRALTCLACFARGVGSVALAWYQCRTGVIVMLDPETESRRLDGDREEEPWWRESPIKP